MELDRENIEKMKKLVGDLYYDARGAIKLTDGQAEIFSLIFQKRYPRNHIMTFTRYGKSFVVALAILTRICTYPEKWVIVSGRERQAKVIMGYIIDHIFDNAYTKNKFEIGKEESEDRIKREKSKARLTFRHSNGMMGEVSVVSADSRNKQTAGDSVMGLGAPHVVLDEASLIDDDIEAKIFRMLGDQTENFYFKIGNPFRLNHFYRDSLNPKYHHLNIDYVQGIKEGRQVTDFIEEAKGKPLFSVLFENKFPPVDMIDDRGYIPIIGAADLRMGEDMGFVGPVRLGVDVAGEGSNLSVWVARDNFRAKILAFEAKSTKQSVAMKTAGVQDVLGIDPSKTWIDNFGEGANVSQELAKLKRYVQAVNVGNAPDDERFLNKRAEAYWRMREWLRAGGELVKDDRWRELLNIKYRAESNRKIKIMSKDEMRRDGMESPDFADALSLTFIQADTVFKDQPIRMQHEESYDPFSPA